MDLNYLFTRQQMERSLARSAATAAAREAHEEMARRYEREIERKSGGRIAFPWHRDGAEADADTAQLISEPPTPSASS